jgi:hypothetical protein
MDNYEKEVERTSKYNSAVAQLQRLNNLLNIGHTAAMSGNYRKWNYVLDRVWCELCADFSAGDKREYQYALLLKKLNDTGKIVQQEIKGFSSQNNDMLIAKQYSILTEREIFLRRLVNDLGKGTKWDDGEDEDFE